MIVKVYTEVEAPEGATHYLGNLLDAYKWIKTTTGPLGTQYWWYWCPKREGWYMYGHSKPHWLRDIKRVNREVMV